MNQHYADDNQWGMSFSHWFAERGTSMLVNRVSAEAQQIMYNFVR